MEDLGMGQTIMVPVMCTPMQLVISGCKPSLFLGFTFPLAGQAGNEKSPSDGERDFLPLDYLKPISTSNNTNDGRCWVDLNFDFGFMTVSAFGMDGSQVETQVHADFW
jgi:hypothetical protein